MLSLTSLLLQVTHNLQPIPGLEDIVFNTVTFTFKTLPNQEQCEWAIEFSLMTHFPVMRSVTCSPMDLSASTCTQIRTD
jgi:hypothetical protein